MGWGLKPVRRRHADAWSRIGWERLEALLAEHYRRAGYRVEHVGTGAGGRRFDGGVDLRLHKAGTCLLVQCKHWNAYQVTHNAVHELLGIAVNQGATGAILVTSGEFTRAAIDAARKADRVQLIDGDALRRLLGPLPEDLPPPAGAARPRRRGAGGNDVVLAGLLLVVVKLGFAVALLWALSSGFRQALAPWLAPRAPATARHPDVRPATLPAPSPMPVVSVAPSPAPVLPPAPENAREAQRKADEAIRVIEATTPEM